MLFTNLPGKEVDEPPYMGAIAKKNNHDSEKGLKPKGLCAL